MKMKKTIQIIKIKIIKINKMKMKKAIQIIKIKIIKINKMKNKIKKRIN
jgi:hypothetical protein